MYQEAEKAGDKAEKDRLSTRVRFHLSHKFGDEKKLMTFHQGKSYAQYIFTIWPVYKMVSRIANPEFQIFTNLYSSKRNESCLFSCCLLKHYSQVPNKRAKL